MLSLPSLLSARVQDVAGIDPELRPATRPQFGHYQSNVALRLAKAAGRPPRDVAADLVAKIELDDVCEPLEIAGPGFINLRIKSEVLARVASEVLADERAGIGAASVPKTVVVDYSSPNVAKQMHVGHLRSTIIGDCFTRVLRAQGHQVIPQNHIGDWGRQFGMLVEQILEEQLDLSALDLPGAEALYQRANTHLKESEEFADRARERVVKLQAGDAETKQLWRQLIEVSLAGFNDTYRRMNILLTDADLAGESTYNADLAVVAQDLESRGIAKVDDGALAVFVEGQSTPAIIRNAQGGFGYTCTDLAAIRHRVGELGANRLIYVVGSPQEFHFRQVFTVARMAGYLPETVSAEFVGFGQVLGADGKKFSTREGTAVTLNSLLDAAEEQAAPSIALAAIKYADLSSGLQKDYTFDAERMVATTGDTGPYLQYAHARANQILRKAEAEGYPFTDVTVLGEPAEQQVALLLSRFGEVVAAVGETLQPHRLCGYLYELAGALSVFYEQCPVLKSEGEVRSSRLALCAATKKVLASGLDLLGIEAPERM
ncbi:arginine--tRNA ligase [Propionicimonas sp.]|uniref:arginine--tRNA ligase n=1 Tax=Propionicimonas sp. TaxID=1955623 RepID=UPI0018224B04|nr:arginine--tRNA ligase [Propionicimonas sp.]MBU3975613.1 arginine--tRNA ligase [Actinomycetota bacterium]MBA3019984.1 arginine--tRNA ligase [Propionicimonas sp.]MBU3986238.1 arginine--tRNA ligase [Actinomycetota bacterium]MBU4007807.1 arginine--tRNA ligase [Actinomycetota bacterium]MBU4064065.1 arginine--tRNA ligase [Actinomycetota bacterium]